MAGINLRAELLAYYQRFLTNGMLNIQVMQDFVTKLQIDWLYIPIYPTNITIIVAVSPLEKHRLRLSLFQFDVTAPVVLRILPRPVDDALHHWQRAIV